MKKDINSYKCAGYVFMVVGCTGIEPVTSCLSSMRSEPTELTPRFPFGETKVNIHWKLSKGSGCTCSDVFQ
jgi:hypothetical protein